MLMLDPFVEGGSASRLVPLGQSALRPIGGVAARYRARLCVDPQQGARRPSFDQRWTAWGAGYGGSSNTRGDPTAGTNNLTASTFGYAGGMDYHFTRTPRLALRWPAAGPTGDSPITSGAVAVMRFRLASTASHALVPPISAARSPLPITGSRPIALRSVTSLLRARVGQTATRRAWGRRMRQSGADSHARYARPRRMLVTTPSPRRSGASGLEFHRRAGHQFLALSARLRRLSFPLRIDAVGSRRWSLPNGHCATRGFGGERLARPPNSKCDGGDSLISEQADASSALGAPCYAPPSVKQILNEPDRVAAGCFRRRARARALWPAPWHRYIRRRIVRGAHLGLARPAPR